MRLSLEHRMLSGMFITNVLLFFSFLFSYNVFQVESARETKVDPIAQINGSYTSSKDVWKYISELGISKVCANKINRHCLVLGNIEYKLEPELLI